MRKRLLLITLAICVLILAVNLVTRGEYLSGRVRDIIVEKARDELGYEVGMDNLVFNLFPSYIDLDGVYVKGWDPDDRQRELSASKIRLYFSLPALLNRQIIISRIRLNEPRAYIVRHEDGSLNIDALINNITSMKPSDDQEGGEGEDFSFSLREIVAFDAGGVYQDEGRGFRLAYSSASADLRILDPGRYRLGLNVQELTAIRPGMPPVVISVDGDALYTGSSVRMDGVHVKAGNTSVSGAGEVRWGETTVLDLEADASLDLKFLETLGLVEDAPAGIMGVKGSVKGAYPDLTGNGVFSLDEFDYQGFRPGRVTADIEFDEGKLALRSLGCSLYGGRAEGEATLDFEGGSFRYDSSIRLKNVVSGYYTEEDARLDFIPWYSISGLVNTSGAGYELSGLEAKGSISLKRYDEPHPMENQDVDLATIRSVDLDFFMRNEIINVMDCKVSTEHTVVDLKGTVGFDGETGLTLSGSSSDIEDISTMIGYPHMDGYLDVTGSVSGNILAPTIAGKARFSNASAGPVAFPSAYGDVLLEDWKLSFTDFTIMPEAGSLLLNGSITFQGGGAEFDNPVFDAVLVSRGADVRKIVSIFYDDIPINVFADGVLKFQGNLDEFGGEANLTTGEGDVYGQPLDKSEVWAVLTGKDISFPKVIIIEKRDILTASGSIGFDGTFRGKVTSSRFDLENFALLMGTGVPMKGSVSLSITGEGPFSDPDIKGNVSAYSLFLKDVDLGEASLDLSIKDNILKGDGSLLDNKVRFDGYLEFDEPMRWMGRLAFDHGRFEPFLRMVYPELPEDVSLVSTGQLTARGAVDIDGSEKVAINFTEVSANLMGSKFMNEGDVVFSYDGGRMEIGSMSLKGDDLYLNVSGGAASADELDFRVKAGFDLASARKFLEDSVDYLDGSCDSDIRVRGSAADPVITGRLSVTGAGVKFRGFPQRFEGLAAEIRMDGKVFELSGLKAELGGGRITASGSGGLKGFSPDNYSFTINAEGVRLKYPEELVTTVDAKLFVEGAESKSSVSGDIIIKKARYTRRVEWKSWLVQFKKEAAKVEEYEPGPFDNVALNIHITGKESIRIDNNVAKLPITPDLVVSGTIANPVLLGRLEATSGQVYFRNNEFSLNSAVAEFADPTRLNPIIDLQAETRVREYLIQLTLSGTLDRINVALLSDPPLDDADIITLLALGRTSEGIEGHEAALTTGEAASFVTGQIQDAVEERMRRVAGFDRFQIDPYLTSKGASSGPRLTVGKRLFSDRLYITFSTNLGTSEDQVVRLEYMINKNLSLVGERDELGRFGTDLKLRFGFK